jgi:uncharacterized membrane protein YdjX (TVP38/TMEM64 family)
MTLLAHGAGAKARLSTQQASAFLEAPAGLTGFGSHHASASSFLSVPKRLVDIVEATPPSALIPLHALSIMGAVPGHLAFELGEGFLFGFQKGFALAFVGKSLGAAGSFIVGRAALTCGGLGDNLKSLLEKWPSARSVARGVEHGGGLSVLVIRLAPLPCVVKNYSLALLTEIPFLTYFLATLLGLLPTTAAHVYAGTLAPSAMALASGQMHLSAMQGVALASPVIAGCLLTAFAGYYLHKHVMLEVENDEQCKQAAEKVDQSIEKGIKRE